MGVDADMDLPMDDASTPPGPALFASPTPTSPASPVITPLTSLESPTGPSWVQDVDSSVVTRPSRASSVVSTHTRYSMSTLQDDARSIDARSIDARSIGARSIDINVGGRHFRINRDASRITTDAPPPYSGPPSEMETQRYDFFPEMGLDRDQSTPRARKTSLHLDTGVRRTVSFVSDTETSPDSEGIQASQDMQSQDLPSRNLSYRTGEEVLSVPVERRRRQTLSQNNESTLEAEAGGKSGPLRRRNGVRLPSLDVDMSFFKRGSTNPIPELDPMKSTSPAAEPRTHSAGPSLPADKREQQEGEPESPRFIGRGAWGKFPLPSSLPFLGSFRPPFSNAASPAGHGAKPRAAQPTPPQVTSKIAEAPPQDPYEESLVSPLPSLSMDDHNSISQHYTRMIRFIDRQHRRTLHARDKELEELRQRLHEVDQVYRQELKARDFTIDDLKRRLAYLEENVEARVEKARNEVEDLWEARWKERDWHLLERMRRIEEEYNAGQTRKADQPEHGGSEGIESLSQPSSHRNSLSAAGGVQHEASDDHDRGAETAGRETDVRQGEDMAPNSFAERIRRPKRSL